MFNKIKQFFTAARDIKGLVIDYDNLEEKYYDLDERFLALKAKATPEAVIEKLFEKGIDWYDYSELNYVESKTYYENAQSLLRNEVLVNELNHYVADTVKEIARTTKSFDEIMQLRMIINTIESIKDRLSSIDNPDNIERKDAAPIGDSVI